MKRFWLAAVLVALVVAALISPLASSSPDGLERVAEDTGFLDRAGEQGALLGDYSSLTGVVGVLVVLGLMSGLALLMRRRRREDG